MIRPDHDHASWPAIANRIEPNGSGLDVVSYAKCEDLESVSEQRLIARLGVVDDGVTFQIGRALSFLLAL